MYPFFLNIKVQGIKRKGNQRMTSSLGCASQYVLYAGLHFCVLYDHRFRFRFMTRPRREFKKRTRSAASQELPNFTWSPSDVSFIYLFFYLVSESHRALILKGGQKVGEGRGGVVFASVRFRPLAFSFYDYGFRFRFMTLPRRVLFLFLFTERKKKKNKASGVTRRAARHNR